MSDENRGIEIVLCPSCLTDNLPTVDFCTKCGCPIGRFVNLDPLNRIYSEGWLYRRAATGRISLFVLIGIWLIFGCNLVITAYFTFGPNSFDKSLFDPWTWSFTVFGMLHAAILCRVTRNYLRWRNCDKIEVDSDDYSDSGNPM